MPTKIQDSLNHQETNANGSILVSSNLSSPISTFVIIVRGDVSIIKQPANVNLRICKGGSLKLPTGTYYEGEYEVNGMGDIIAME